MKPLKSKRIFTLIWIVLALSALHSIYTLIKGISQYANGPALFWLAAVKLTVTVILLIMSLNMGNIVKAFGSPGAWQAGYYHKVKKIGYWAIILTLLNAAFQLGYETMWSIVTHAPVHWTTMSLFRRYYAIVLMETPALWVLTLSIFLFAELLRAAHQVKSENESFI